MIHISGYFEEQIAQGQPIVPPTPVETPQVPQPPTETQTPSASDFIGLPVRTNGDRVFLIKGGKKAWIMNPAALEKLGFTFADVVKLDQSTLDVLAEGEPISG